MNDGDAKFAAVAHKKGASSLMLPPTSRVA
jgi:hypothetical protein